MMQSPLCPSSLQSPLSLSPVGTCSPVYRPRGPVTDPQCTTSASAIPSVGGRLTRETGILYPPYGLDPACSLCSGSRDNLRA